MHATTHSDFQQNPPLSQKCYHVFHKHLVVRKTRSKNINVLMHVHISCSSEYDLRCCCSCHINLYSTELKCGSDFPLLHFGLCMTYDNATGATEYGPCPDIANYNTNSANYVFLFSCQAMCLYLMSSSALNWEGQLCEKCKYGYDIALYSYTMECSKCWGHGYGWVLYYFLEFFPITQASPVFLFFGFRPV